MRTAVNTWTTAPVQVECEQFRRGGAAMRLMKTYVLPKPPPAPVTTTVCPLKESVIVVLFSLDEKEEL